MKIGTRRSRGRRRGSVLLLVLFLLIVLGMMGSAFSILLPVEMRNAQRDHQNLQTAYAADAAVLHVMGELEKDRSEDARDALVGYTEDFQGDLRYRVAGIEEIDPDVYRVVTEGIRVRGLRTDVLRRAVAIIDNGDTGAEATFLVSSGGPDDEGGMSDKNGAQWPGDVPIRGDVIVAGHWAVDDTKFDPDNGPLFDGVIKQTVAKPNSKSLRGESYVGSGLTTDEAYEQMYLGGKNSVQTIDPDTLPDNVFLEGTATRRRLLTHLFENDDPTLIDNLNNDVTSSGNTGLHIALDASGKANGGIVINAGGGDVEIEFQAVDRDFDTPAEGQTKTGNSVMLVKTPSLSKVFTLDGANNDSTSNQVAGAPPPGSSFKITHVTEGFSENGLTIPAGEEHLVIQDSAGNIVYEAPADFSVGSVIYANGSVEARGTFAGSKTVAASAGVTITGELLKFGLDPGEPPTSSEHVLGMIANIDPSNSSEGFAFDLSGGSQNDYHIYCSLMGLSKTNQNAKIFGNNINTNVPSNVKLHFYGQLASGPTNHGQFKKEIAFIDKHVQQLVADNLPPTFPTNGTMFRSRLRAYVDQQVYRGE